MNPKPFGLACLVTVLTACSSQPQQPAANAPAPAPAAPAAALATPAAAPTAASVTEAGAPEVNRTLISAGYKPKIVNGEVVYCRTVDVTNTAFKKKICLNEAQIKEEERKVRELQRDMMQGKPNGACVGPQCG